MVEYMNWRTGALALTVLTMAGTCRTAPQDPLLFAIEPGAVKVGDFPTLVRVSGEGLHNRVRLALDRDGPARVRETEVRIGDIELDDVQFLSSSELTATVPGGLAIGVYDVEVRLGDGETATLERAFEVLNADADASTLAPNTNPTSTGEETPSMVSSNVNCTQGDFGEATPIWSTTDGPDYGPSLAANDLLLLFSRKAATGGDVVELYFATRPSLSEPFGTPQKMDEFSGNKDMTPIMSPDGLRIVFTSNRSGNWDLWHALRTNPNTSFGGLEAIPMINTGAEEVRPWLSSDWLTIFFESNRDDGTGSDIWEAKRLGVDDLFSEPRKLAGINTAGNEGSPSFTADKLRLFYLSEDSANPGARRLFEAHRAGSEQDFEPGTRIESLAKYDMTGYASVSTDGREVVFSAPGPSVQLLYRAVRRCP